MSGTFDVKSLPLYRQLALFGGGLLFISLFFPWWSLSGVSFSGWNGLGTLAGILVILLIAWEVLRVLGQASQIQVKHDLVTAALAGLVALFGLIQFIRALTYGSGFGGPGFGAFLILIFSIALGYAAFLAFQAAGGTISLPSEGQAPAADPQAGAAPPAAPPSAPSAPPAPPPAEAAPPAPAPAPESADAPGDDERPSSPPLAAG